MTTSQLDQLRDLLAQFHDEHCVNEDERENVSGVRSQVAFEVSNLS